MLTLGGAVNQSKVSLTSDDCWSCARASRARKMFTCFNDTSAAPSASEACIRKDQHNYLAATWYAEYDCPPTIGMAPASTARNTLYRCTARSKGIDTPRLVNPHSFRFMASRRFVADVPAQSRSTTQQTSCELHFAPAS